MRFSLRLNNDLPVSDYIRLAQTAESAGFHQFWVSHDLFLGSCPVIMAAVAQATERIEIGTGILNPYTINPAELAMMAATMDELSGNRFNLGIAAGAAEFLGWIGLEQTRPMAMMRETITVVRCLLAGERAALDGQSLSWTPAAYMRRKSPRVTPIYVGAMGPKMLQLAGEMADGVLPLLFPPEHYFNVKPLVDTGLARRTSPAPDFDFAACVWVSLSPDRGAAEEVLAKKIAYYGASLSPLILGQLGVDPSEFGPIQHALTVQKDEQKAVGLVNERMMRIGVVGQPQDVIDRLEPLVSAGATHLSFGPPLGPDPQEAIRLLGRVIAYYE